MVGPDAVKGRGASIAARARAALARALRGYVVLAGAVLGCAQEVKPPPVLPPGATRDEVIDVYGWPTGQSKLGA